MQTIEYLIFTALFGFPLQGRGIPVKSRNSTGSSCTLSLPDSMADMSKMSLSRFKKWPAELLTVCTRSAWASDKGVVPSKLRMPTMPLNGVRSSWLMLARKRLLPSLAASAFCCACRSCSLRACSIAFSICWLRLRLSKPAPAIRKNTSKAPVSHMICRFCPSKAGEEGPSSASKAWRWVHSKPNNTNMAKATTQVSKNNRMQEGVALKAGAWLMVGPRVDGSSHARSGLGTLQKNSMQSVSIHPLNNT